VKIAIIGNSYPPEFQGGTELVMAAQAEELLALGHSVQVVCGSDGGGEPAQSVVRGVTVQRIPREPADSISSEWCRERIVALVEEATQDCDLLHLHHWSSLSGDLVRRLSRRVPVVVTLHDHYASCPRFFRSPIAGVSCPEGQPDQSCTRCVAPFFGAQPADLEDRLMERWRDFRAELLAASAVICPSENLRSSLARELEMNASHWSVVPHGLCRDVQRVDRIEPHDKKLTVISFGNRAKVKGTLLLVRAMSALPEGSVRLILTGEEVEPGYDAYLRDVAGGLELEIHGTYDERSLAKLCARADLAAFPSDASESYGLVVEEALALGLPTWVSDRGALGEVLRSYAASGELPGAILPAAQVERWTHALLSLVDSPAKLQDARARVPKIIRGPSEASRAIEAIYTKLVSRQPLFKS
jgi:glycosyltransferase involved in cell wall biosynthesis